MVTPRELQWVKSIWASRPGGMLLGEVDLLVRAVEDPPVL